MGGMSTWLIYGFAFASAFLAMQAIIGAGRQSARKIAWANVRMKMKAGGGSQTDILAALRKSRGLERGQGNGRGFLGAVAWLDKQVTQSGLPLGVFGIYLIMVGMSATLFLAILIIKSSFWFSLAGAAAGLAFPVLALRFIVKRRRNKAVAQLPAALDVIVRSLRAGHPVPVAIELVAREMPDPIGTEFGMASDEITYGTSLGKALQRLAERVGHADFDLLAATIRLQERTGGNLAELLQSNAHMVRERQKMRLKIKSASSEGRMSALILNIAPILLFFAVQIVSPDFYGNVNETPIVKKGLIGIGIWMLIGNLVMRKMINFRI